MHLLQTKPGGYVGEEGITHLAQSRADIIILSAADTDIALLASAYTVQPADYPSLRLANLLHLRQHAAVDLYVDEVLQHARLIVLVLLGGVSYWPYGVEQLTELCTRKRISLALIPGDDTPDPELIRLSNVPEATCHRIWRYLREGGPDNARSLFAFLGQTFFAQPGAAPEPKPLPRVAIYHPRQAIADLACWRREWRTSQPVAALLFYRAHLQADNTQVFDALIAGLQAQGLNPLPIALTSLKEPLCLEVVETLCRETRVKVILNTTGFSLSATETPLERPLQADVPVLQVILAGSNEEDWRSDTQGLTSRDLAMNVALPEVDGRVISRAVSFKGLLRRCKHTEVDVVAYRPVPERVDFVAQLAHYWTQLALRPNREKRIALILANYPTREGRLGNGVGLDTPASVVNMLRALQQAGYPVAEIPPDGTGLMQLLLGGVTNDPDSRELRPCFQSLSLADYQAWFAQLPDSNRSQIRARWGAPEADPMVREGRIMIPGHRFGLTFLGIQPARGYHLDLSATYHDPDLVPPHAYLAFYCWLRQSYRADAVVHVGKHGNLEWLPGKSIALSQHCWPDLIFGPLPHVYPFIVNDPGEGAQAKRRAQAVIIDHLVPPLTRAESYGPLRDLERLVDEYYDALSVDPRRAKLLRREILEHIETCQLHRELGFAALPQDSRNEDTLLQRTDAYLCELKEAQIRDGLHIFGESPRDEQRIDTLLALARLPYGNGQDANASLLRVLSQAFALGEAFDPLDCLMAESWLGPRPTALAAVSSQPWRTQGDTRERLELYARQLLAHGERSSQSEKDPADLRYSLNGQVHSVLQRIHTQVAPNLDRCGPQEMAHFLAALDGRFVPAGPSGAPSRGRLEVLPTGRNFYSVDVRAIPTVTAWRLGFQAAALLIERHLQEQGDFPRSLGLSVWGTATMRTGGDDIAQAFALLGVRPVWAPGSNRVVDFEILPVTALDRPRVDVMLRVSGFFRDAFSNVIRLFDAAVQAVAALDEPEDVNPLRARIQQETQALMARGLAAKPARQQAGWRIFGSKPGAYGAGLQGPIDERHWSERADLATAYVNWGGYAYGQQDAGTAAHDTFRRRLAGIEVILHNQDNREHDILDSDDYYQFQGGMAVSVETLRGERAVIYHGDHSQPQAPRIRTLQEEINRVIRSRVVNPKWIEGVKRHGYKGAFEMAATVDYLFAYDATTQVVQDYQYALVADAYLLDPATRTFLEQHNPHALREMSERLLEAMQRGMWEDAGAYQEALETIVLAVEEGLEQNGG